MDVAVVELIVVLNSASLIISYDFELIYQSIDGTSNFRADVEL